MKTFFSLFFCLCHCLLSAQDINYARSVINVLASEEFHGRGYVEEGDGKAAKHIAAEFKKHGLKPACKGYFQKFKFPVNTFPGQVLLKVDTALLQPGADYLVHPASGPAKGKLSPSWLQGPVTEKNFIEEFKSFTAGRLLILDITDKEKRKAVQEVLHKNPWNAAVIILLTDEKLTWSVSQQQWPFAVLEVKKDKISDKARLIEVHIESELEEKYKTQNVAAFIRGAEKPDSFLVFTAHYDHLGRMGKSTYFPGANDNASGTAMLLDLARHYAANPPAYSVAFITFAAEEAGLVGSGFYVNNPLFPLSKIRFLVNLDLMGNGDEGITVVNGAVLEKEFNLLTRINKEKNYLPQVNARGKAANSDHYHFSERGVPAFFIYTLGGGKAYHDIYDKPGQLTLVEYEDVFRLITDFAEKLQ